MSIAGPKKFCCDRGALDGYKEGLIDYESIESYRNCGLRVSKGM